MLNLALPAAPPAAPKIPSARAARPSPEPEAPETRPFAQEFAAANEEKTPETKRPAKEKAARENDSPEEERAVSGVRIPEWNPIWHTLPPKVELAVVTGAAQPSPEAVAAGTVLPNAKISPVAILPLPGIGVPAAAAASSESKDEKSVTAKAGELPSPVPAPVPAPGLGLTLHAADWTAASGVLRTLPPSETTETPDAPGQPPMPSAQRATPAELSRMSAQPVAIIARLTPKVEAPLASLPSAMLPLAPALTSPSPAFPAPMAVNLPDSLPESLTEGGPERAPISEPSMPEPGQPVARAGARTVAGTEPRAGTVEATHREAPVVVRLAEPARGGEGEGQREGERQSPERLFVAPPLGAQSAISQSGVGLSAVPAPEVPLAAAARPAAVQLPAAAPVMIEPVPEVLTSPPKELVLTIPAAREGDAALASVHVRDQNGAVEIAVRTPDTQLSNSLQDGLPDLVTRLEAPGFEASAQGGQDPPADPDRRPPDQPDAHADAHPDANSGRGQAREERLARWRESLGLATMPI